MLLAAYLKQKREQICSRAGKTIGVFGLFLEFLPRKYIALYILGIAQQRIPLGLWRKRGKRSFPRRVDGLVYHRNSICRHFGKLLPLLLRTVICSLIQKEVVSFLLQYKIWD